VAASVNYTGRLVDMFIFQNAKLSGDALIHLGFDGENGSKVTSGIQKMAQTWAILFLTEVGSIPYDPAVGTSFVTNMRLGLIRDEMSVKGEFGLAATAVHTQMATAAQKAQEPLPADEQLELSNLIRFNLDKSRSKLTLYVRLTSQAGTKHDILLPIPVAIQ
jgi:hypothetical protein